MSDQNGKFKAAVVQAAPAYLDREATLEEACALIAEAAGEGARLAVFPEVFLSGYPDWVWLVPNSRQPLLSSLYAELVENAVSVPDETTRRLCGRAAESKIHIAMGMNERNDEAGAQIHGAPTWDSSEPWLISMRHIREKTPNKTCTEARVDFTETGREFLKSDRWDEWRALETDQKRGIAPPPLQKPYPEDAVLIELVAPEDLTVGRMPLIEAIGRRRSRRKYTGEPLALEELSFLLWATQGVQETFRAGSASLRTVPSGGARHPFETYLLVNRVGELKPGLYRYLPLDHKLCFLRADAELPAKVDEACYGQYVMDSAVVFIWTVIPYRTEWRYGIVSPKIIAQDSGHLCQNLYLAAEAIGAGTCAIGAYDQDKLDPILGVDGTDEFAIYLAPVGRVA